MVEFSPHELNSCRDGAMAANFDLVWVVKKKKKKKKKKKEKEIKKKLFSL